LWYNIYIKKQEIPRNLIMKKFIRILAALLVTASIFAVAFLVKYSTIPDEGTLPAEGVGRADLRIEETKTDEPIETKEVLVAEPVVEEPTETYLGDFVITYYCKCEICCDEYANNRPIVNGQEVVYTFTGEIAQEGTTIAVDSSKIPYGTTLYIEGIGFRVAQDCGGAIKGNRIDVYMDSHQEALEAGMHTSQVWLINT
jgi:3D (Asp-Asp-Asp) domain-containing protein